MGDVGNRFGDAVIETSNIFTGRNVGQAAETVDGHAVWDRYHYGAHAPGEYAHIGLASTEISTKGIIGLQSNPTKNASVLTALP